MDAQTVARRRDYINVVLRKKGGIEAAIAQLAGDAGTVGDIPPASAPETEALRAKARKGLEAIALGNDPSLSEMMSVEAIIDEDHRPAFDVVGGKFEATHREWLHLSSDAAIRTRIEAVLPSIGRIELPGQTRIPYGGTAFVVGDGLIMTNRHVAEIFAAGLGDRRLHLHSRFDAGIDFVREYGAAPGIPLRVRHVVMIHPYWDMALLAVEGLPANRKPLLLSTTDARDLRDHEIVVVGYPAFDSRNPADVQDKLFNARYGIKRLQPGEMHGSIQTASFGKLVPAAAHDCSTLGGNSGSAIVDLGSGEVLALHFGGRYHEINFGVPSAALGSDSRVVQAGVRFSGATSSSNAWGAWWMRADAQEATLAGAKGGSVIKSVVPDRPAVTAGSVSFTIPLQISVSLGVANGDATAGVVVGGDQTEAMREPAHDGDYSSRAGYAANFLGDGPALEVPMPSPVDDAMVATTLDGSRVLHYQNFSIAMHARRRLALFTASNVTKEPALRKPDPDKAYTRAALSGLGKNDTERWFVDPRLDPRHQLPDVFFTNDRQSFDKGHIVRRDDVAWGTSYDEVRRANGDSYHVTNCSPQVGRFNQSARGEDNWGDLENIVLASAASERLCVLAGPVLDDADEIFVGAGAGGVAIRAKIPSRFWKVVVAAIEGGIGSYGFVLEQDLSDVQWEFTVPDQFLPMMVPIADIEAMTGISFGDAVRAADQFDTSGGVEMVFRGVPRRPGQASG